jgi:hypothetical protein
VWFGEIERKLAKLSKTTFTDRSSFLIILRFFTTERLMRFYFHLKNPKKNFHNGMATRKSDTTSNGLFDKVAVL